MPTVPQLYCLRGLAVVRNKARMKYLASRFTFNAKPKWFQLKLPWAKKCVPLK